MTYAKALRKLLKERGMTQYALAKATGKSRSYISELCSGKIAEPTLSVAFSIADALGVPLQSFYDLMRETN